MLGNLVKIEEAEFRYFITIKTLILNRIGEILNLLNSRIAIINDWKSAFVRTARKGYKQSDLNIGAERIFHNWASAVFKFPNSTPIGADLVFDSEEGFRVHIDIKTALDENPADWQGVVNIGKNQTSYTMPSMFNADLPTRYSDGRITLTYIILVIHKHLSDRIDAVLLTCVPNGELLGVYGSKISRAGKGGKEKGKDFRFKYIVDGDVLRFKLLTGNPPRVEIITALKGSVVVKRLLSLSNNQLRMNRWH